MDTENHRTAQSEAIEQSGRFTHIPTTIVAAAMARQDILNGTEIATLLTTTEFRDRLTFYKNSTMTGVILDGTIPFQVPIEGDPQQEVGVTMAWKTGVCHILAPYAERAKFLQTVGNLILRNTELVDLPSAINRKLQTYPSLGSLPFQNGGRIVELRGQRLMRTDVPEVVVQSSIPILAASHVVKTAIYDGLRISYSLLWDDPLLRLRMTSYTFNRTPRAICVDGMSGQNEINAYFFLDLVTALHRYNPHHPIFEGDDISRWEEAISLFSNPDFYTNLLHLTKAKNGTMTADYLSFDDSFVNGWEFLPDGTMQLTPEFHQKLHATMRKQNHKSQEEMLRIAAGKAEYYSGVDNGTTNGCPLGNVLPDSELFSDNPLDVTYLPPDWYDWLHRPYDQLINPIDTIHAGLLYAAKKLLETEKIEGDW